MKNKKLMTAFIGVVFFIVVLVCFFSIFSIKSVDAVYLIADSGKTYSEEVQKKLNKKFLGRSLLFAKAGEVNSVLKDYPYLEVTEAKKSFPNKITVSLKERQEIYLIKQGEDEYILDETGFIVNKDAAYGEKFIDITGVELVEPKVGEAVFATENELLFTAFKMSGIADYTDNVEKIEVVSGVEKSDLIFHMRTGLKITVIKALDGGEEKMKKAFDTFDDTLSDYEKGNGDLLVYKSAAGEIIAAFTEHGG